MTTEKVKQTLKSVLTYILVSQIDEAMYNFKCKIMAELDSSPKNFCLFHAPIFEYVYQ